MAVSEDQTEEAIGYAAEGKKFAKEYTPPDVSVKDAVKFVAEMTPIIGDAMAAKEVWDELQKEEINWRMVGALAGAGAVGLVPFFGDAAGKLIKQGASKALKPAKNLDAVATGVPQYKMDGNAPASVFDNTVTQEAVDFIQSGSTSQKDLLRIARDNGIVSGPGTGTMPAQVIAELGDRVRNPDFRVIQKNFNEGGAVNMDNQMKMFEEGGIADDGMTRDPVSGNEVPPGSLAREVRDDVPAQLSDGEYVVPADVVRFFGVKFFEDLRMTAKQGLQQMEKDGRIGGEPMDSPAPQSGDDPLSPDEQELLQEIMAMEQAPQQPQPSMAVGGVVNAAYGVSVQEGGNVTEDIPISTRTRTTGTGTGTTTTGTGTGTTATGKDGMVSVFYIHPDGRRVKVLLLNGKPVGKVPDDFTDFVTDTPENRIKINFQISDETPVGAGTAAGAGTKAPGDDKMEERNQPGGDLYKEPKPKTFEDIGINGADPKAGALAVLGAGKNAIAEGAEFVGFGLIGAGIQGITQAEVISIAHANALYAEDILENDALAAEIRAEIKTYVDDQSIFLADVITDIASAFVKPGQNRLNDYEELGGKTAQEESKLSAEDIVKKRAEEKAEKERIEKERIEKARIEKARLAKLAIVPTAAESEAVRVAGGAGGKNTGTGGIGSVTNTSGQGVAPGGGQGTGYGGQTSTGGQMTTPKYTPPPLPSYDPVSVKEDSDYLESGYADAMNKGGLIARPKKKTKKKKK